MGEQGGTKLGFLDSLGGLFRAKEKPIEASPAPGGIAKLEADFDAAVRALNEKIQQQKRAGPSGGTGPAPSGKTAAERAAERVRRLETAHRAIREDIEKMHARLGTGLSGADIDAIAGVLEEIEATASAGKDSHELLPRARWAIVEKLRAEAGELAVARVVALLERQKLGWPDPAKPPPSATPEEIERSRRRRLADVRRSFLADGFARTAESMRGIVKGWGADYPDRGSPLWESCVLEGVAAGIRGSLLRDFVECLRKDREQLLSETEAAVGKELQALQAAVAGGVQSLEKANQAVAGALRVLDEVIPTIAWERVRAALPEARGEFR
jgi:hypothetical protein